MADTSLMHYGVKGMKWGVRKDKYLKRGTRYHRVALTEEDPIYGGHKYLSISKGDHRKWQEYIGGTYGKRGRSVYDVAYTQMRDVKIASDRTIGEAYVNTYLNSSNPETRSQAIKDIVKVQNFTSVSVGFNMDKPETAGRLASLNIGLQTPTGLALQNQLIEQGYGGAMDSHGRNVADNPIIMFEPDKNLKKSGVKENRKYVRY